MKNGEFAAFPLIEQSQWAHGLTKREYFAALAMQGLNANPDLQQPERNIALIAVAQADALLAALEETQ